ncbi:MAG: TetR/AcrR family transcriptional regulator [Coriobacteriales bacterium]|jgi:AcrR family transcriptional regulator|nr:TetR/AcrR family transcriptional regulator [Coriobacteriales bacterium]
MVYQKKRAATEAALTDAFIELYLERDLAKITVGDIIRRAGYNRSTFYAYFRDVPDILDKSETRMLSLISDMSEALVSALRAPDKARLESLILSLVNMNRSAFLVLFLKAGPETVAKIARFIVDEITEDKPELSEELREEMRQYFVYHFSAANGILRYRYGQEGRFDGKEFVNFIFNIGTSGVITCLSRSLQAAE